MIYIPFLVEKKERQSRFSNFEQTVETVDKHNAGVYTIDENTRWGYPNKGIIGMAMERKVLFIEGMTCINCQNRIEQALRNTAGISAAHVSYGKGQAEIEFDNEILSIDHIIAVIQELDYTVVKKRKNDHLSILSSIGTLAIIILLYYLLQRFGILNLLVPSMLADSKMSYGMLFIIGLLTSVHCIAMCGGINLSQCIPIRDGDSGSGLENKIFVPSLLYNTGRVISYK